MEVWATPDFKPNSPTVAATGMFHKIHSVGEKKIKHHDKYIYSSYLVNLSTVILLPTGKRKGMGFFYPTLSESSSETSGTCLLWKVLTWNLTSHPKQFNLPLQRKHNDPDQSPSVIRVTFALNASHLVTPLTHSHVLTSSNQPIQMWVPLKSATIRFVVRSHEHYHFM